MESEHLEMRPSTDDSEKWKRTKKEMEFDNEMKYRPSSLAAVLDSCIAFSDVVAYTA